MSTRNTTERQKNEQAALNLQDAAWVAGGVSVSFIRTQIRSGALRSIKAGDRRLVLREDLESWLLAQRAYDTEHAHGEQKCKVNHD